MYRGSKEQSKSTEKDLLPYKTQIQNIQDVFVDQSKKECFKSIMIEGNPGQGKTVFCRKLLQEWSQDEMFNQDQSANNLEFKFVFLIPFRQLNMVTEREMNFGELLNYFSMLDEKINDSVIEYIIQHPEQLLIIMDGYDEYEGQERQKMNDQYFESQFPDKLYEKMPVAALVSKLLKKKILPKTVVMVTSRPTEASELKNLSFDCYVEISGFSEDEVLDYVKKYFSSNQEMQAKALRTIQENNDYISFGQVPLMCALMCVYMEHNISNTSDCFPDTLTSFYTEIIQCIEINYNKTIKKEKLDKKKTSSVVEEIKNKLSELAAKSLIQGKYNFSDEDLGNLQIPESDLTYLKSSSLLFHETSNKKSALSKETIHKYSFSHTSIQEYFAARYFVLIMKKIPSYSTLSHLTLGFMAGLMNGDKQLMYNLLEYIWEKEKDELGQSEASLACLFEFDDKEFTKRVVQENKHYRYRDSRGGIYLSNIDSKVVLMLLDVLNELNEQQALPSPSHAPRVLSITNSPLTLRSSNALCSSLTNAFNTITVLHLYNCNIDDKCVECLCRYLPHTKLTFLNLLGNNITINGVEFLVNCNLKLKELRLVGNEIADVEHARKLLKDRHPHLKLYIV